jgi:two-component system, OmpR family, sensor kinase
VLSRLSLRARLLLGVVLLAALGLVAADVATYSSLRSFLLHRVDFGLETGHKVFEHPPPKGQKPEHESSDHQGPPPQGVDWYQVRTLAGHPLRGRFLVEGSSSAPKVPAKIAPPTRASGHEVEGDEFVRYFDVPATKGDGSYRVRASIEPDRPHQMLLVASSLGGIDSTLHRLLLIELIATVAVLAALAALALWVVRLGLRPLGAIEATAAAITAGDSRTVSTIPTPAPRSAGSAARSTRCSTGSRRPTVGCAASSPMRRTSCGPRWPPCAPTPSCSAGGRPPVPRISSGRCPGLRARPSG